jgi:hypothetical protein
MEKNIEYWGVTRISNPKTLQRWMDNGEYQTLLDAGYVFNVGCGRFRTEKCTCSKCKRYKRPQLQILIDNYN